MTSINFNASATTALRTLQQTNSALETTQNRVSTGLKIGEAKDNAAYWAISTTLKSDNKSLSTVKDALNLGVATVETAYQGLNKAKDVLDEIKSKLTAATQDGVDRNVIQSEITELQKQLSAIATSSTFSGENWLSVDSSAPSYGNTKSVVSSFSRDSSGAVSIGTVTVDISKVALFDASTVKGNNGIIDGAISLKDAAGRDLDLGTTNTDGNTIKAGLTATASTGVSGAAAVVGTALAATSLGATATVGTGSTQTYATGTGVAITGILAAGDSVAFTIGSDTLTVTLSAGQATAGALTWADIATDGVWTTGTAYNVTGDANGLVLENVAVGTTAAPTISAVNVTTADAGGGTAAVPTAGTATPGTAAVATSTKASVASAALDVTQFAVGDKLSFTLNVDGASKTYTTGALVAAGGTLALSDILTAVNAATGLSTDAVASFTGAGTNELTFTAAVAGAKTVFSLEKLTGVNAAGAGKTINGGIGAEATSATFASAVFEPVTLDANDNLYFKIQVDDATGSTNVTIDQALINKTLSTAATPVTSGEITTAADFKKVLDAALAAANVKGVTTAVTGAAGAEKITFASATQGVSSKIVISDVKASAGADEISVATIDISDAGLAAAGATSSADIKAVLTAYVSAVNEALAQVTTAAANLGAVSSRIELQSSFIDTLVDTIDKGISGLVDADLSEESTKLQALQTKQQLGIQALSIANSSQQNILRLFQ